MAEYEPPIPPTVRTIEIALTMMLERDDGRTPEQIVSALLALKGHVGLLNHAQAKLAHAEYWADVSIEAFARDIAKGQAMAWREVCAILGGRGMPQSVNG